MVQIPEDIPHTPGVYLFTQGRTLLYIGKAADLKKRLASYFRRNASDKVRRLREEATALEWIETDSGIEALIREAELIKRHVPKYNILMRDDKSYLYVVLTREQFPRVVVAHKTAIADARWLRTIGPFTSGTALYATLKILRRIFPYCTCRRPHRRPCVNAQIGRCPGFCCDKSKSQNPNGKFQSEYNGNIKNIIAVLSGRRRGLAMRLKREMRAASHHEAYERAAMLRDQIARLEDVFRHRHTLSPLRAGHARVAWPRIERDIRIATGAERRISRVEGYDISNISGISATGSLVVFVDGAPAKSAYRKFRIKTVRGANDVAMHREVMRRRMSHPEWPYPDLIVMDGGKPQLHAASAAWSIRPPTPSHQPPIIVALAKREEELYIEGKKRPVRLDSLTREVMHFFQRVRDESHRFAKKYHHKLREIDFRE
ncbi:MAG: GIY-YIG nuclease family protein [Patescibacteria group bacterium]